MKQCHVVSLVNRKLKSMVKRSGHYSVFGVYEVTQKAEIGFPMIVKMKFCCLLLMTQIYQCLLLLYHLKITVKVKNESITERVLV